MNKELQKKILAAYRKAREEAKTKGGTAAEATNRYQFPWSATTFGSDGRTLYVVERSDRPGVVRVRWQRTPEEQGERGEAERPWGTVTLSKALRNDRGRLSSRACDAATEAAKEVYEEWLNPPGERLNGERWSLERTLKYYVDEETGQSFSSERWREQSLGTFPINNPQGETHMAVLKRHVDFDLDVTEWGLHHHQQVWKGILREAGDDPPTAEKATKVIATVYAAANFCRNRAPGFPEDSATSPPGWRKALKEAWSKETGLSSEPDRPPYTTEEARKIASNLDKAEPRLRMALILGVGYRVQQVAGLATRSNLSEQGEFGLRLTLVDQKRGGARIKIDLSPRQQALLRYEMTQGYLSDLEAAYQNGEIEDYALVPGYRLKEGKAQVQHADSHLGHRTLARYMKKFEALVGVPHINKRLFHGLRRAMRKLTRKETSDPVLLDIAGGWTVGGGTGEAIYTDEEDEETLASAARARAAALDSISAPLTAREMIESLAIAGQRISEKIEDVASWDGVPDHVLDEVVRLSRAFTEALDAARTEIGRYSDLSPDRDP